ncbi:MAG TPA: hypothetical protein VJB06_01495, partial [archaeon]|nr:hypothetical protein [archaeon]
MNGKKSKRHPQETTTFMWWSHKGCHPNAPMCHANTEQQQHTLEVSLTEDHARKIRDGKHPYACSVMAYPLRTPAEQR